MKLCECGCGQELPDSLSHGKARRFIHGHQSRGENHPLFGKSGEKSPNFGKHRSEETKKKMRKSRSKHWILSEETKKKISGKNNHNFGKHFSKETKRKMRESQLGKHLSEETKKKISEVNKVLFAGEKHPNFGKHLTDETKKKISESNIGRSFSEETKKKWSEDRKGEKHWNWQGGISKEEYTEDWTDILKESIRCRDHYTCRLCGKEWESEIRRFQVHHIDYNKKHCDPQNLITLCVSCHMKTSRNEDREYYTKILTAIMNPFEQRNNNE